ncbi:substrate-binding domain-containing protein [Gaoshiqia sediminis]|uniref:Substrate-binding domain-containing protein n=1 Tax=Gaoshiqia sediminis TaxID=2986998 RepID=A0AA41Y658_9BACT|nr:substrate-binding domain-containing protein [Gaoshiqia sediminis]MCW0482649.1 substrate-binding domain-containing protein [Gaoshiqia sediminis]
MRQINLTFQILLVFLLFAGCNQKPEIGLLMDTIARERWVKDRDAFVQKVNDLGGSVTVKVADSDASVQFQQALEMINAGIDVLVIIPVDMTVAAGIVKMAKKQNIPVISYDRLIRDSDIDFYVSTDNIDVGEQMASFLTTVRPTGNYVLIGGPTTDNNSFQLHLGWMNVLQPLIDKGDIKVVSHQFVERWEPQDAYQLMSSVLNEGHTVDAVIAGNDALAQGAIDALAEHGMAGKALVAGQDADITAIRNIILGNQTITIYKPIESLAFNAADAAVKMAKGKKPSDNMSFTINNGHRLVPAILLNGQVVNKQNIRMTVISEGFVAEQEIFE